MDQESRSRGGQLKQGGRPPSRKNPAVGRKSLPFAYVKEVFPTFLPGDIKGAKKLLPELKKYRKNLTKEDQACRERLLTIYYEVISQHRKALRWGKRALRSYTELGQHTQVLHCNRLLFSAFLHLGSIKEARRIAEQVLLEPNLPLLERQKFLLNLSVLEFRSNRHDVARKHITELKQLLDRQPNERILAYALLNLGNVLVAQNNFVEAEECLNDLHNLKLTQSEPALLAGALQAIGNLFMVLGQYFQAEEKLKAAKKAYLEAGDDLGSVFCDYEIFRMEIRLNRVQEALEKMTELVGAFDRLGRREEVGQIYYHGAQAAMGIGDFFLGGDYLARALRLFRKMKNEHAVILCELAQGIILWKEGHLVEAEPGIRKSLVFFSRKGYWELELECRIYLWRMGRQDWRNFRRIQELQKSPLSPWVKTQALILISAYWYEKRQWKRSLRTLFEAVNMIEETRASISSDALRQSFFEDKTAIYELLIHRLLEWRDPQAKSLVFKVMELSRSRQMVEQLSSQEDLPPILNRDSSSVLRLERLQRRMEQLNRHLQSIRDETESESWNNTIHALRQTRNELVQLQRELSNQDRLGLFFPLDLTPEAICELLDEGHLVVLFFLTNEELYRIELDVEGMNIVRHALPSNFERDFKRMMNALAHRMLPQMPWVHQTIDRLSPLLIPNKKRGIKHVTFIMHKHFQRFPIALLRDRGRYFIEDFTVSQCPNLPTFYFAMRKRQPKLEAPLFFFSDHPSDPQALERGVLFEHFPHARVVASLDQDGVAQMLADADFIHFAGHCSFNARRPAASFLQLGQSRMSLAEFANIRLHREPFINFATCHSGGVVLSAGNEPHGFVISSLGAGAANILASHWEIDDEATGDWMKFFYRHLHLGLPEAYRQACLKNLARDTDPYLWAGFTLLGGAFARSKQKS